MTYGLIEARTRSQVRFPSNTTRTEENENSSGRTRSKMTLSTRNVKLRKVLNTVLDDCIIEHANKRQKTEDEDETSMANVVLDSETRQMIEFRHLVSHKNPKIRAMWNESTANEL